MKKTAKNNLYIWVFLLIYFITHLLFLTSFPFVHSDEAWLSGLSRAMMETKSIYTTEPFFDLYPRFPHSIKILFHIIQMPFIYFGGYSIFSLRLISLIFSLLCLYIFYQIVVLIIENKNFAIFSTFLLSLNIQFIYAAHFARQEILILFVLLLSFYIHLKSNNNHLKATILLGSIIGLSVGIHPNSFIVALIFGFLYLFDCITHRKKFKNLLLLVFIVSSFASFFVILSFIGDADFITHYLQYGSSFGVDTTINNKLLSIDDFYYKLYHSISGTYYVPNIKYFWISFLIVAIVSISILLYTHIAYWKRYFAYKKKSTETADVKIAFKSNNNKQIILKCLIAVTSIQLGILIIGRFNSTSIVFSVPFFYILLSVLLEMLFNPNKKFSQSVVNLENEKRSIGVSIKNPLLNNKLHLGAYLTLVLISISLSYMEIKPYLDYKYNDYLHELNSVIPENSKTLANLSAGFAFNHGQLFDYRNLTYLNNNHLAFEKYIKINNIEYIVYYEEMEYIHNNPQWLVLYGEDYYYDDMMNFITNHCTEVHYFTNMVYGIRIPKYMMEYPWEIRIYKVEN